jgi:hypothetical protein
MGANSNAGGLIGGELGGGESEASPSPTASPNAPCVDPDVGNMIADLTAMANAIPAAALDVNAAAQSLPGDPSSIYAYVRDNVRLDAYDGALRGPLGTLMGLAGNPTDKALLLAELLKDKGFTVRFARGTLSDAEVQHLSDLVRAPTPQRTPVALATALPMPPGYDEAAVDKTMQAVDAGYDQQMRNDISTAQSETAKLSDQLASSNVTLESGGPAVWSHTFKTHYWVQVQQGDTWTDLDPSAPDLAPGKHLGTVDGGFADANVPDSEFVKATLTLTVDGSGNGKTSSTDVLTVSKNVADLVGQRVQLLIGPPDKSADIGSATSLTPTLAIGSDSTDGSAIDVSSSSSLQAVRLQITVQTPNQPDRSYRRVLFDRRADGQTPKAMAYGVSGDYEFLVVPAQLNDAFEASKTLAEIVNQQAAYTWADAAVRGTAGSKKPLIRPEQFPIELLQYVRRDWLYAQQLGDAQSQPVRFFYDRPDIVMLHRGFRAAGDHTSVVMSYDIFDNGMTAVGDDATLAAKTNLARGYLDTALEERTLAATPSIDTIAVMDAADKAGVATTVVTPSTRELIAGLGLSDTAKTNLDATLDAGQVAIIPKQPVSVAGQTQMGWWAIDPRSGNAVGRMSSGGGQAMTEYVVEQVNAVYTGIEAAEFNINILKCIAQGISAPLAGQEGEEAGKEFIKCIAVAMCKMGVSYYLDEHFEGVSHATSIIAAFYKPMAFHFEVGHPALCEAAFGGGEGGGGE